MVEERGMERRKQEKENFRACSCLPSSRFPPFDLLSSKSSETLHSFVDELLTILISGKTC